MSLTFHRTFSLSRPSLTKIIQLAQEKPGFKSSDLKITDLGTRYQEAMPRYAYRAGLTDEKNHLTDFGRHVAQSDLQLQRVGTQWLLHYHLAALHRPTAFWNALVSRFFLPSQTFTSHDLVIALKEFTRQISGKEPSERAIRGTVTIFCGTYLKSDGLGQLRLLNEIEKSTYQVASVTPPPLWAFGYALADYWHAKYEGRLTINLDDLSGRDFAGLFLLGENTLNELLLELKKEGMIDLYRISRPYQVVLLQPNPAFALERLYRSQE